MSWGGALSRYAWFFVPLATLAAFLPGLGMLVAYALVVIAIPYTLIATYKILALRGDALTVINTQATPTVDPTATRFGTLAQKMSLINGVTLGVVAAAGFIISYLGNTFGMTFFALVAFLSAIEIAVNTRWIYSWPTAVAEEHAIRTKNPWSKVIRFNRWLGWAVWYTGCAAAVIVILRTFGPIISI